MGDHPEDHFALPIRELGPQPDHPLQALVLHRGGASVGDTLDRIATNRLSRHRGAGVGPGPFERPGPGTYRELTYGQREVILN